MQRLCRNLRTLPQGGYYNLRVYSSGKDEILSAPSWSVSQFLNESKVPSTADGLHTTELSEDQIRRLALLCRLDISDAEMPRVRRDLGSILRFVEQITTLNPEIPPLVSPVESHQIKLREDTVSQGNNLNRILKNSPQTFKQFIAVPKVRKEGL